MSKSSGNPSSISSAVVRARAARNTYIRLTPMTCGRNSQSRYSDYSDQSSHTHNANCTIPASTDVTKITAEGLRSRTHRSWKALTPSPRQVTLLQRDQVDPVRQSKPFNSICSPNAYAPSPLSPVVKSTTGTRCHRLRLSVTVERPRCVPSIL